MNILVVVPHLDDETFGMYGTLEKYSKNSSIKILVFCEGRRTQDRNKRIKIFKNNMDELDIEYKMLDYLDLELNNENPAKISDIIKTEILSTKADIVYTTGNDLHIEHELINRCVRVAVRNTSVRKLLEIYIPGSSDISKFSSKVIEKIDLESKIKACEKYISELNEFTLDQVQKSAKFIGQDYGINAELFNLVFEVNI